MACTEPSSFRVRSAVELTATASTIMFSGQSNALETTLILFMVSVPVLSVQITVVAPMVSQACSLRTRFLTLSILRMLNARLTVTLIGSPSGTATTISVTAIMTDCNA